MFDAGTAIAVAGAVCGGGACVAARGVLRAHGELVGHALAAAYHRMTEEPVPEAISALMDGLGKDEGEKDRG